jgi:hypothetical protein
MSRLWAVFSATLGLACAIENRCLVCADTGRRDPNTPP